MTERCIGVLLAGGQARRMGGGDKALQRVGAASILERVVAIMGPQCAGLILNANGDPARFEAFHLPVVPDDLSGFKGPLAGVLAGLDWTDAHRPDIGFVVSAPTDTPFLPGDLAVRLAVARRSASADIAVARSRGVAHPVVALWPVAVRADLRHALIDEDLRKVGAFVQRYKVAYVDWAAAPFDPFFNANDPGDLEAAKEIAAWSENPSHGS